MPSSPSIKGPPVTNERNTTSPHWRRWLKPESRCLVPANSFSEYAPEPHPETGKGSAFGTGIKYAVENDCLELHERGPYDRILADAP
jgi:putative SOS response-associated peptidase YedK